jgi:hypothetical protein
MNTSITSERLIGFEANCFSIAMWTLSTNSNKPERRWSFECFFEDRIQSHSSQWSAGQVRIQFLKVQIHIWYHTSTAIDPLAKFRMKPGSNSCGDWTSGFKKFIVRW